MSPKPAQLLYRSALTSGTMSSLDRTSANGNFTRKTAPGAFRLSTHNQLFFSGCCCPATVRAQGVGGGFYGFVGWRSAAGG